MKNFLIAFFLLFNFVEVKAARVDTVVTHSQAMNKDIKAIVVVPDAYSPEKRLPVLYLLHGYSGNYADWINNAPAIKDLVDYHQILVVCPDGNFSSWYLDSPIDTAWKYETYVAKELVAWVDAHYGTRKNSTGRGICGLSMGGHGALYLAIKHPDVFGATCALSGGVNLVPFPNNWDIAKRLGPMDKNPERWQQNSVVNMVNWIKPNTLAIALDCGKDDFFYPANLQLHQKLDEEHIAHDFTVRPGAHNWAYWSNAIKFQMQFFANFFYQG